MIVKYLSVFSTGCRARWLCAMLLFLLAAWPGESGARIYIDINSPSVQKFKIAIPNFKNLGSSGSCTEMATELADVVSNDLDLSGYFSPMDQAAFLEEEGVALTLETIRFKNWSVIGADLLIKGGYSCAGDTIEVQLRLFDVFQGKQLMGKRALGNVGEYRYVMHRLSHEIIRVLTGHDSMFLTKLAFVGNESGHKEIYRSDFDGYNVKQLTSAGSISLLPRWSPDGEKLLYTSYKDDGPKLYLMDLTSRNSRPISARSGLNIGAAWSPDGRRAALTLSEKGNPDIFTIDLKGKILQRLTDHWGIDVSPTFSPKGDQLAFVSNRSGSPQIYRLDINTGREERLTFEFKYCTSPVWSALNRIAFVAMDDGNFDIYAMDPDGSRLRKLTDNQGNNEDPSWSPDGRYLVFSSNRRGTYNLCIMTANGQNQRRITFMKGDQTSPSWAP
jgi:TolB protein